MTSTEYNPVVSLPAPFEVPVTEAAVPVLLATTTEPFASVEVTAFVGCTLPLAPEAVDTARSPRNNVTLEVTSVDAVEKVPTTMFSTIVQSPITKESVPPEGYPHWTTIPTFSISSSLDIVSDTISEI